MWQTDASCLEKEGKVGEAVTEIKQNSGKHDVERAEAERDHWLPAMSCGYVAFRQYHGVFQTTSSGPTGCSDPPSIAEAHVRAVEHARPKTVLSTQKISTCVEESVTIDTSGMLPPRYQLIHAKWLGADGVGKT